MFGILERIFFYDCACCRRSVPFGRYMDGAYDCLDAGWGSRTA